MALSIFLTTLFFLICSIFGFTAIRQLLGINSLLLLTPLSISCGLASYIFITHLLSFVIGPKAASIISLITLIITSILILATNRKNILKIKSEINKNQAIIYFAFFILICVLTSLIIFRFGIFDKDFHLVIVNSIFHNNVYPPMDPFKSQYVLIYHYGVDLLAGAINHISKLHTLGSLEIVSVVFSGTTFLSFFALAWLLTKNFKLSTLVAFCTYFGGSLLWLDAIIRQTTKQLPEYALNWNILQTIINIGIHGSVINPPSEVAFSSTHCIGYSLLILSLILFINLTEKNDLKDKVLYIFFILIVLQSLNLIAEWLYMTFWAGAFVYLILLLTRKQKQIVTLIVTLFILSFLLTKTIGNPLFLENNIQNIGRVNLFNIAIKEKLFWITGWGRLTPDAMNYEEIYLFSWRFLSEFGLSIILIPLVILYLFKTKNNLAILLFFIALASMPVPLIIEFKANPADFNRLFGFGNIVLILLATCGIGTLFKQFLKSNSLIFSYITVLCLSPILGLIFSLIFTPHILTSKDFSELIFKNSKSINPFTDIPGYTTKANKLLIYLKNEPFISYQNEIKFLRETSKPQDVAISTSIDLPLYAGIYTIAPANKWLFKDGRYTSFDSTHKTIIETLDPHLLNELNIKWILIDKESKNNLTQEAKLILNDKNILNLTYKSPPKPNNQQPFEIYNVNNIEYKLENHDRKTAWVLVNKNGYPIDLILPNENKINIFPTFKQSLNYLNNFLIENSVHKKTVITSQAIVINELENQIKASNMDIKLDMQI